MSKAREKSPSKKPYQKAQQKSIFLFHIIGADMLVKTGQMRHSIQDFTQQLSNYLSVQIH